LVFGWLTGLCPEYDEHDQADQRDKPNQLPPPAFINIVQATGANGKAGNENGKTVNESQNMYYRDYAQHNTYDKIDQEEHPKFLATCPAIK
jgi:hypothetical protein